MVIISVGLTKNTLIAIFEYLSLLHEGHQLITAYKHFQKTSTANSSCVSAIRRS